MNFSIGDLLDNAWQLAKRHGILLAVYLFVAYIVGNLFVLPFYPSGYWEAAMSGHSQPLVLTPTYYFGSSLNFLVMSVFSVGLVHALLRMTRGANENIAFSDFKLPLSVYLKYIVWQILYSLIVGVGMIFFIIPGIFFAARLSQASTYIIDHPESGLSEAISFSWRVSKGQVLSLFGLFIVLAVIVLAGLLICCIGVCFTAIIAKFAITSLYIFFHDRNEGTPSSFDYQKMY